MALIHEDGTGKDDAESYLEVLAADAYWLAHGDPTTWSGATTAQKEAALRQATEFIDERFGAYFKGARANESQRLRWPRFGVVDSDGFTIPNNSLPRRLLDATAFLANESISDGALFINVGTDSGMKSKELVKVGPITIEDGWSGGSTSGISKNYSKARALLLDFFDFSTDRG